MAQETRNAYGEELAKLVEKNSIIVVLDADLSKSTKTAMAQKVCPERHFNAGIAECNMMGMAAGLAASGKTVFASSFAVFATGRAFEIIRNSICYPKLNVKICATHAGLAVGEDGASHQAIEDVAIMRALPNMRVFVPCDQYETKAVIDYIAKIDGPCYVRLGRGKVDDLYDPKHKFNFNKVEELNKGKKVVIFAMGLMVQEVMKALPELKKLKINPTVVDVCSIKPIDEKSIIKYLEANDVAYVFEEANVIGGLYSVIAEIKGKLSCKCRMVPFGINDTFGESGKMLDVLKAYGLTSKNVVKVVKNGLKTKKK